MSGAILYNIFVCWVVSFAGFFTATHIFKQWKGNKLAISYGYFWLGMGILWLFVGVRTLFYWLGYPEIDKNIFLFNEIFVAGHMIPIAYYLSLKIFKKEKIANFAAIFYAAGTIIFLYFVFGGDIGKALTSNWGTDFPQLGGAKIMFLIMEGMLLFGLLYDAINFLIQRANQKNAELYLFFATLAVLIYAIGGYFDGQGYTVGWQLLLIRILMMAGAFIAYLSYAWKSPSETQKTNRT